MGGQYSGGLGQGLQHPLLPPPKVCVNIFSEIFELSYLVLQGPQAVIRDKKSGNNAYSAAGDDDIGVVEAEEDESGGYSGS